MKHQNLYSTLQFHLTNQRTPKSKTTLLLHMIDIESNLRGPYSLYRVMTVKSILFCATKHALSIIAWIRPKWITFETKLKQFPPILVLLVCFLRSYLHLFFPSIFVRSMPKDANAAAAEAAAKDALASSTFELPRAHLSLPNLKALRHAIQFKNLECHLTLMNTPSPTSKTWRTYPLIVGLAYQTPPLDLHKK